MTLRTTHRASYFSYIQVQRRQKQPLGQDRWNCEDLSASAGADDWSARHFTRSRVQMWDLESLRGRHPSARCLLAFPVAGIAVLRASCVSTYAVMAMLSRRWIIRRRLFRTRLRPNMSH